MGKDIKFDRVLGGLGATAISLGGIIGSGIFFIIGFASGDAGPGVIISLLLAAAIAGFTALSFASLGSKIPKEGGEYQFVYAAFGPAVGFVGGIFWVLATAIGGVTASVALAGYLTRLIPIAPMHIVAALACGFFVLLDMLGLRFSSKINDLLVIVKVGILILFILITLPFFKASNFDNLMEKGPSGIFSATFLIFFAYAGFGKITAAAEEVKEPEKNIPKAILAGIAISTILYIAASVAAVGAVGAGSLASPEYRNAPFANVMLAIGVPSAFLIISIGAIAATASVLLIQVLGISRTIYAMSKNGQLPSFLSELHPQFKSPYKSQIVVGLIMALSAFFLNPRSIIELTSLGILSYYALINLSAFALKKEDGSFYVHPIIPVLGFTSCVLLISFFLWTKFT